MILCHPNHPVYVLNLITATNWTLTPAVIGATVLRRNTDNYHDSGGRVNELFLCCNLDRLHRAGESSPSTAGSLASAGHSVGRWVELNPWSAVAGAVGYNITIHGYSYFGVVPSGVNYGFIGTCTGTRSSIHLANFLSPADIPEPTPGPGSPVRSLASGFITISQSDCDLWRIIIHPATAIIRWSNRR